MPLPSAPISPRWIAIAAMARNRVIGADNRIPWHLPEELRLFKRLTLGHTLVMGRKTFQSIGRPLPGRTTWVLTQSNWQPPEGVRVARTLDEVRPAADHHVFVAGGGEIYRLAMPRCQEILLTTVNQEVEGDVTFPLFEQEFIRTDCIHAQAEFETWRWERSQPSNAISA